MPINELRKRQLFSLEAFPPKKEQSAKSIYEAVSKMARLHPDYMSVTYGAGGSDIQQQVTVDLVKHIQNCGVAPLAHITCINSSLEQVDRMLDRLEEAGVHSVLALRGDKVEGGVLKPPFLHASDLIAHIAKRGGFEIFAACYPEGHPDSDGVEDDVTYLRKKVDAGATGLISQLFFDNADFYRMRELCTQAGIRVPIEAGIMPVVNAAQVQRMVTMCGAKLPPKFSKMIARYDGNPQALYDAGINYAIDQVTDLLASGVDGIHVYAMNNPDVASRIFDAVHNLLMTA